MALVHRAPTPPSDPLEWMSAGETAREYGVSLDSIYRAIKAGTLPFPAIKIGGQWRIRRADFEAARSTFSPDGTAALLNEDEG